MGKGVRVGQLVCVSRVPAAGIPAAEFLKPLADRSSQLLLARGPQAEVNKCRFLSQKCQPDAGRAEAN